MNANADLSLFDKLGIYSNVLNHILIGAVSLYVTWQCWHVGFTFYTWHVWLSTIGVSTKFRSGFVQFSNSQMQQQPKLY